MIVGENARADEMDVNPTKEKKLNNIRSATAEDFERLTPALNFSWSTHWSSSARMSASRSRRRRCAWQGAAGPGDPRPAARPGPRRGAARADVSFEIGTSGLGETW